MDYYWMRLAGWLPKRLAYFAFVRVFAASEVGYSKRGEWAQEWQRILDARRESR